MEQFCLTIGTMRRLLLLKPFVLSLEAQHLGYALVSQSLFGWIGAQIPVQPHKCSAFGLRGVAVRMHWSTAADRPKS